MKGWLEKLNDPDRDVYERRYRLLSAVSIVALLIWLAVASIVDFHMARFLFFAICDLLFIPTMLFTLRSGRIQLGAGGSAVVLVFLMLPFAFFFNGGINAGAPNWGILAMVFVTLTVRGGLRTFLLISDIVVTMLCYVLTAVHPEWVVPYSTASAYVDSLASLIITGVEISVMFLFQLHMANQTRDRLEAQRREIEGLNESQSRFFSSMSHEIRTPVSTIIGLNEMILREDVSPAVVEDAAQVRGAGELLLHLINDILDMSKLESGRMTLTPAEYDVGETLYEIAGMIRVHAKQKGLEFRMDVDPDTPARLIGDETRVKQILINVLNNAVKYTEKGSVTFSVQGRREDDGGVTLITSVADTGIGIRKESMPDLFTAFKRVDEAKNSRIEGTGLGLSIVRQLVDLMGGRITVNSVYTRGTTFVIEIPQKASGDGRIGDMDAEGRRAAEGRQRYVQSFEAPEARVLIVDDNAANRMVTARLLEATGMRIDTAAGGAEALKLTLANAYHLVFMDHMMPGMDGVECLHRMRRQVGGLSKAAKVVALTANAGSGEQALYAREGFDSYLAKPCEGVALERECVRLLPAELVRVIHSGDEILKESMSWMEAGDRRVETAVTTDSIADLPRSLLEQYGIAVIPHAVRTAEGVFKDGLEIESGGLLDYMDRNQGMVKTLPPTAAEYEAFFAEQLSRANNVVHISISGGISGSGCAPAREGAVSFHNVFVVDSGHLSSGEGLLALEAGRMAREGLPPDVIAARLEQIKRDVRTSFIVDSLDNMARANLVGPKVVRVTTALMIHPVLKLKKGRIGIGSVHIGSRRACWKKYIAAELRRPSAIDRRMLFVTYVGLDSGELDEIRAEIDKHAAFEAVVFKKASPAIAVNCGRGTFGLLYRIIPRR